MRHRRHIKHFSRKSGPRKALLRGLVESLVEHGRITTTVEKAKEVRRHVEKAITLGKKETLASHRLIISRFPSPGTAENLVKNICPRFKSRSGGYTRIIKIGRRPGDTAEMAFLEFVDFDFTGGVSPVNEPKSGKENPVVEKKGKKSSAVAAKALSGKRKAVKKIQSKSRQAARA